MSYYRSPQWNVVGRILRSYLRHAFTANGLMWTADNDAEVENLVESIHLAVTESIRAELQPPSQGHVSEAASHCCRLEHGGDQPGCPVHSRGPRAEECTCLFPLHAGVMPHCPIHGREPHDA